jgi:N-succinyldiaminopimelate aminotransferase
VNRGLDRLHPYPFQRLNALVEGVAPPPELEPIPLSIGEPRHAPPADVIAALSDPEALAASLGRYPPTLGTPELKTAARDWLVRRFRLPEDSLAPSQVLPVTGTREALFALAQAFVDARDRDARVLMPNPFYQIYEGAALLAGAEPVYVPCPEHTGWLADLDAVAERDWARCRLFYLCAPGNPCGAAMTVEDWRRLIELADAHDFVIAADECYSEIHLDEARPPVGLLQACAELGRHDYARCIVLHSLSKRSNLPGLRSGFVAGDAAAIERFGAYRTYHGCGMPLHVQAASTLAWNDETHVKANRAAYREKFDAVLPILEGVLDVQRPDAGFFLWPAVPGEVAADGQVDEERFVRELYAASGVLALPGRYLSRPTPAGDPGAGRIRLALVAPLEACVEAAERIRDFVHGARSHG